MSVLKKYNEGTSQWEAVVLGKQGPSGTVAVTAPLTNSGTDTAAVLGLNYSALQYGQNAIINGGFDIWQRGTSVNAGVFTYVSDRWATVSTHSGGTVNYSRQAFTPGTSPVPGISNYIRMTATSPTGASANTLYQRIEDVNTFAGQTVTFSFWAKASSAISLGLNPFQDTGTGGSGQYSAPGTNVSVTTSWQRFTHTYVVPGLSGKTVGTGSFLAVEFLFPVNTSITVEIAGAQLEAGSVATPFKRHAPSIQGELAACQRYYYRASCTAGNPYAIFTQPMSANLGNQAYLPTRLPVTMRTPPSSVEYANLHLADNINAGVTVIGVFLDTNTTADNIAAAGFNVSSGLTQYRAYVARGNNSATAYLAFSAEL